MPSVLITGANRGIGLEFATQFAADGWEVHGTARDLGAAEEMRDVPGLTAHRVDTSDHQTINELASTLQAPLDLVIANAGVMGGLPGDADRGRQAAAQTFGSLDYSAWLETMMVNTFGTIKTLEAFTPHVEAGTGKKMVAITSRMASIDDTSADYIAYRTSKAALNMAVVAASQSLNAKGIAAALLHPGWVRTNMGGPNGMISATQSVEGLRTQIDNLTPTDKAPFLAFDGTEIPW